MKNTTRLAPGSSADRATKERRAQTLQMLRAQPKLRVAVVMDDEAERTVTLAVAIRFSEQREVVCCDYTIERDKFSGPLFMEALECGAIH